MSATFQAPSVALTIATLIDNNPDDLSECICFAACDLIGTLEHVPRRFDPEVCVCCGRHVWLDTDLVEVCHARSMPVAAICRPCDSGPTGS